MPARRITTVTIPVDPGTTAGLRSYTGRTPLLTVRAGRSPLMVTLTLPEHLDAGHVRFARELADTAGTRPKSNEPGAACPPSLTASPHDHKDGPGQ